MTTKFGPIYVAESATEVDLGSQLNPIMDEIGKVVGALSTRRLVESFRKNDDGSKGKSVVRAVRRILETELALRGWSLDWTIFPNQKGYLGADYKLDAIKKFDVNSETILCGFCMGWVNPKAAPTSMLKAELLRNVEMNPATGPLDCMVIVAPTLDFKKRGNFDTNASTTSTYRSLSRAYASLIQTTTVILPMPDPEGFVIEEIPGSRSKKSRIIELT